MYSLDCFVWQELEALVVGTELEGRLVEQVGETKYVRFNSLTTVVLKAFQELNDHYEVAETQQKEQQAWQQAWNQKMEAELEGLGDRVAALEKELHLEQAKSGHLQAQLLEAAEQTRASARASASATEVEGLAADVTALKLRAEEQERAERKARSRREAQQPAAQLQKAASRAEAQVNASVKEVQEGGSKVAQQMVEKSTEGFAKAAHQAKVSAAAAQDTSKQIGAAIKTAFHLPGGNKSEQQGGGALSPREDKERQKLKKAVKAGKATPEQTLRFGHLKARYRGGGEGT